MGNVISLDAVRNKKNQDNWAVAYHRTIQNMDKQELLEEMVAFQEDRAKEGSMTLQLLLRGKILFSALNAVAETPELKQLTTSYLHFLSEEMDKRVDLLSRF